MTLHETYTALLMRGMPPHERLKYVAPPQGACVEHTWPYCQTNWGYYDGDEPLMAADESDARDLLTMHALRWCYDAVDAEAIIERYNGPTRPAGNTGQGFSLEYMRAGDDSTGYSGFGESLLDAIIAATEHLEPKRPPGQ